MGCHIAEKRNIKVEVFIVVAMNQLLNERIKKRMSKQEQRKFIREIKNEH